MTLPRGPGLAIAAIAAVAVAAAAGCQRDKKKKPHARRITEVAKPPPPVRVLSETVVTRGAEPHRLLRYTRSSAARRFTRAITATVTEIEDTRKKQPRSLPRVTQRFELRWKGADLLEVAVRKPEIGRGEVDDRRYAGQQLRRFEALLVGKAATAVVDDRGRIGDIAGLDTPSHRELAAALVDSIVPLPDVPVGVGARWRLERTVPRVNSVIKQRATYQLESVEGDRLVIAVELLNTGERQPVTLDGPARSSSELLALRVFQTGKLTVALDSPTAAAGALDRTDVIHLRTTMGERTLQDYYAESTAKVELETGAEPTHR